METQWRVSWEMVGPFERPDLYSSESWLGPFSAIEEHDWQAVAHVIEDEEGARKQYGTLVAWAIGQTEAIRNVKLETREPGPWTLAEKGVTV